MKYKEFKSWCNDRACDGRWSAGMALNCLKIMGIINKKPFWKREKVWQKISSYVEKNISAVIDENINDVTYKIYKEEFNMPCVANCKPRVVFDFDGVIHSYKSGWQGAAVIPDEPVEGIKEAIEEIRAEYLVAVVSTRCADEEGMKAVCDYLRKHDIPVDEVLDKKPPAVVYIDDRAICFDGNSKALVDKIKTFKPWHVNK